MVVHLHGAHVSPEYDGQYSFSVAWSHDRMIAWSHDRSTLFLAISITPCLLFKLVSFSPFFFWLFFILFWFLLSSFLFFLLFISFFLNFFAISWLYMDYAVCYPRIMLFILHALLFSGYPESWYTAGPTAEAEKVVFFFPPLFLYQNSIFLFAWNREISTSTTHTLTKTTWARAHCGY